jgi:hypothetical protein
VCCVRVSLGVFVNGYELYELVLIFTMHWDRGLLALNSKKIYATIQTVKEEDANLMIV